MSRPLKWDKQGEEKFSLRVNGNLAFLQYLVGCFSLLLVFLLCPQLFTAGAVSFCALPLGLLLLRICLN